MVGGEQKQPRRLGFIYRTLLKGRLDYYANILEPREKSYLIRFFFKRFRLGKIPEATRSASRNSSKRAGWCSRSRTAAAWILFYPLFIFRERPGRAHDFRGPADLGFLQNPQSRPQLFFMGGGQAEFLEGFPAELLGGGAQGQIDDGNGMLTYLINPGMVAKRYLEPDEDSFYNLLRWQEESDQDYYIVPLVVVWNKTPEREERGLIDHIFGTVNNPGPLRRLYNYIYLILAEEALVEAADPVNLRAFMDKKENQGLDRTMLAHRLREHLMGHFEREKRVIIGPVLKSRSQLMEEVLSDRLFNSRLDEIAKEKNKRLLDIKREAAAYLDEMAANYNQRMIGFLDVVMSWVFKNLFSGIEVDETGFEKIRNIAKRHPIVYVPSHKSHVDYLVLSYVLYHNNFFPPHIVAGINLSFFPLGQIFRGSGAFFMRRTFKGNKVYALVFSNYLKALIKENYPIEFFIEGGRSRTGRLLLPKMGVVKYMVRAYRELGLRDLQFVPVYIGYDQVIEQAGYVREVTGQAKKESRLKTLPRSQRMFREQYGKIYLGFGEPISLKQYLENNVEPETEDPDAGFENLGYDIVKQINRLTLVTPGALIACALLTSSKPARKLTELQKAWGDFYGYLAERKVRMAKSFGDGKPWHEEALAFYHSKKLIAFLPEKELIDQIVSVQPAQRLNLEFYKNNIVHFLLPAAMTALLKLSKKSGDKLARDYQRLKSMLRFEFVFPEETDEAGEFKAARAFFDERADEEALKNFAGVIANFLESYSIALQALLAVRDQFIMEKDFVARAYKMGAQAATLREIERPESVSRLNFQNAFAWIKAEGWFEEENRWFKLSPGALKSAERELAWINSLLETIEHF